MIDDSKNITTWLITNLKYYNMIDDYVKILQQDSYLPTYKSITISMKSVFFNS